VPHLLGDVCLALADIVEVRYDCPTQVVEAAYSDDGDRRFRFIVTGLERGEVLDVNDNSVGHDGLGIGTGFWCFAGTS
jgi:hypothetical protein